MLGLKQIEVTICLLSIDKNKRWLYNKLINKEVIIYIILSFLGFKEDLDKDIALNAS